MTRIKRRHCQTAEEQRRDREMSRAWLGDVRYMGKFSRAPVTGVRDFFAGRSIRAHPQS
jgi:hypothetical protein